MTIRYKCDTCGSTLNIKDELAGTDGKCPKCKTAFSVPQPSAAATDSKIALDSDTKTVAGDGEETITKPPAKKRKPVRSKSRKSSGDDFDPMAVLMGDEPGETGGGSAPASPPLSDDELPAGLDLDLDLEMGEEETDDTPRTKKTKKRKRVQFDSDDDFDAALPNSAASTADTMLGGGGTSASAGAKDLLTRTMEEGRARAARMDDEEPGPRGPTIKDYARAYGPQAAGILAVFVVAIYGLFKFADVMYGGGMPLPDLGRVYGTITLDDQPLEGCKVRFTPVDRSETLEGKTKHRLRSSTATTNAQGEYDLYYTEDVRGAAVTEHYVIIKKLAPNGRLVTPAEYFDLSRVTRTVESGSNPYDFDLKSDAKPEPAGGGR